MILEAFYSHLAAEASVTALVNGIFPLVIPHGVEAPAVTYTQQSDDVDQQLGGTGKYRIALIDVDCWALTYSLAEQIADAIEAALIDYRGQLGATTPVVDADHVRLERRGPDTFEQPTEYYRVQLQFLIGYEVL